MEIGKARLQILNLSFDEWSDKRPICNVMFLVVGTDNEQVPGRIWLTEKAAGIARKSFKAMGFDIDVHDLAELQEAPEQLMGNECDGEIEEYNGKFQVKNIGGDGRAPVAKAKLLEATKFLRGAKKEGEEPVKKAVKQKVEDAPPPDDGKVPF